jgi:glucokinase
VKVEPNYDPRLALAIDIGGTKLACGVVDASGNLTERKVAPTPSDGDGESLFLALTDLVKQLEPFDRFSVCGVGVGGPMSAGGEEISTLNIKQWRSFPLAARVAAYTGLETRVDNDAKALALAEGWVGAAVSYRNFMAMVVSTGVGGGIVLDGRLLEGVTGNAGHVGHIVVEPDGHDLPGHVRGVLEAEASGTAIAHHTGLPAKESCTKTVARAGCLVGRAAGDVANLLDLKLVVVAGSVALGLGEPFFAAAQAELDRVCQLDHSEGAVIVPAGCGDQGPLVGAGAVGFRHLGLPIGIIT